MNVELHHAWRRFRDDDDSFVLVITGAGETTFSAGWDLQDASELAELGDWDEFRVHVSTRRASAATRAGSTSSSR